MMTGKRKKGGREKRRECREVEIQELKRIFKNRGVQKKKERSLTEKKKEKREKLKRE